MNFKPRPRPDIGIVNTFEKKFEICRTCGCIIDLGLCNFECPQDGDEHPDAIIAVYQVTEILLREEDLDGNITRS